MAKKRFSVEQIIHHLRESDVLLSQGETVGGVCRQIGVVSCREGARNNEK